MDDSENKRFEDEKNGSNKVDFGFQQVDKEEKIHLVHDLFSSVANRYDVMNDVMSLGLHRQWKKIAVNRAMVRPGMRVLDVASGTGDLAMRLHQCTGPQGEVVATDVNENMLQQAQMRFDNAGIVQGIRCVVANAETLPFDSYSFDRVTIAFGLRNVTDKLAALRSMYRVLKTGGKIIVMEFSKPQTRWFEKCYDQYSFHMIPKLGKWIANDEPSYRYLVESIRMHPDQETLAHMMREAGFEDVCYENILTGVVAIHTGIKFE